MIEHTATGLVFPRMTPDFDPEKAGYYFKRAEWSVLYLPFSQSKLVRTTPFSPLLCADGRSDLIQGKNGVFSPRVFGQWNAVAAMTEGGDISAYKRASQRLDSAGYRPGTHSPCGYFELWLGQQLESVKHGYELPLADLKAKGIRLGAWLEEFLESHGGSHQKLVKNHREEALSINPFEDMTENAKGGWRFRVDDFLLSRVGVPLFGVVGRLNHYRETVAKLKPDAMRAEIIVPDGDVGILQMAI